jgi:hypothetical protein
MVVTAEAVTVEALIVKAALVNPAGTVTDTGTRAASRLLLLRVITAPPLGAAAVSATVPVGCPWLLTDDWLRDTADKVPPDTGAGAGLGGFDGALGVGLGLGEDGVPLPQFVTDITKLAVTTHQSVRRSAK